MNSRFCPPHRQSGAALIVLLALLLLVSAAILLDRLDGDANASANTHSGNAKALAEAKNALIAWAATYPPSASRESTPGNLPYPDRDTDGNHDGMADCDALGVNDLVLIGRLPRSGEDIASCGVANSLNVDLRDGAGEPLWYAVSRNVLAGVGVAGGPINPDMGGIGRMAYPWIRLKDAQGNDILDPNTGARLAVAAVVFAPGAALANQNHNATAATNYLDNVDVGGTTYDNADTDGCPDNTSAPCGGAGEEIIVYANPQPGEAFNDELIVITADELMRATEKRVLGEVELALDAYRNQSWNTANVFPWLAGFRSPRAVSSGAADGGSSGHMDHAAANFIADGVQVGDIIVNIDDGSNGPVTAVTATRIDFDALQGGTENDFDATENYEVRPSFKSTLARRGQLPVHLPNEIFQTSFTATWDLSDIDDYYEGTAGLRPDENDIDDYGITVTAANGRCMWTEANRVDCYGEQVIPNFYRSDLGATMDQRLIQVSFSFPGRDDSGATVPAVITPPTAGDVRRRSVSIDSDGSPPIPMLVPVAAPNLPQDLYPPVVTGDTWTIRVTDTLGGNSGTTLLVIDADTDGDITVSGIRYDLSIVYDDVDDARDEVPEWFVENNWHHFMYVAASQDRVAGGNADADDDCTTPANSCLSMNVDGTFARSDIPALVMSSGVQWTNQDRDIGDCDGDGGGPLADPTDDSFLCAYFDSDTSTYDVSTDILRHGVNTLTVPGDWYARDSFGAGFNDQVRTID